MPTREEIYQQATLKNLSNSNGTRMDIVYAAMSEYAKQRAVEFEKWRVRNFWKWDILDGTYSKLGSPNKRLTTSELYDLFLIDNPE